MFTEIKNDSAFFYNTIKEYTKKALSISILSYVSGTELFHLYPTSVFVK